MLFYDPFITIYFIEHKQLNYILQLFYVILLIKKYDQRLFCTFDDETKNPQVYFFSPLNNQKFNSKSLVSMYF